MKKSDFILDQTQELMCELWQARYVDQPSSAVERNIFEADMKKIWNDIELALEAMVEIGEVNDAMCELEEENAMLENDITDLINRNYDLAQENERLKAKLEEISKVVNDTWC